MAHPPSGRIRRTAPVNSGVMGWVYRVCFDRPIRTAAPRQHWPRHYTGWTEHEVTSRMAAHEDGTGSRLFALAAEQGIGWKVVATEYGDRNRERQMKQRSASRSCPRCRAERQAGTSAKPLLLTESAA